MATHCAVSSSLALPSILHHIFRSEFARDLRLNAVRRAVALPKLHHSRLFSATTQRGQIKSSTNLEPSATYHSDETLQNYPNNKHASIIHETKDSSMGNHGTTTHESSKKSKNRKISSKERRPGDAKQTTKKNQKPELWQIQKEALDRKFPAGWNPPKKLSPDALEGIRHLNATAPERFTTAVLAEEFKVSPEAIRRILKSKWRPSANEMENRRKRWEKRHERIWSQMAELGLRPSTKRSRPLSDANTLYGDSEQ